MLRRWAVTTELGAAHEALKSRLAAPPPPEERIPAYAGEVVTAVAAERLRTLNEELLHAPDRINWAATRLEALLHVPDCTGGTPRLQPGPAA